MPITGKTHPVVLESPGVGYLCIMGDAEPGASFADLIANGRRTKGWTQEDLERESGISRATVSRWERGLADRPEAEHVRAVCKALGIDPRRAAVALGYLTAEEIQPAQPSHLDAEIEEILAILPLVTDEERRHWINYLRYLRDRPPGRESNAG